MLRDERQVAINRVVEALLAAAHVHEQGADLVQDRDLAPALRALAEQRRRAALELGEQVRRLGDLPPEPDADIQAAKDLLARLQIALTENERERVVQRCRDAEDRLAELARVALAADLPADARTLLQGLLATPGLRTALGCA